MKQCEESVGSRKRITAEKRRDLAAAALRIKVDREPVAITKLGELSALYGLSAYDAPIWSRRPGVGCLWRRRTMPFWPPWSRPRSGWPRLPRASNRRHPRNSHPTPR